MSPENTTALELLTAIWSQLKAASERLEFDYDGPNFDVSAMPEKARPGIWRCRISHNAHRHQTSTGISSVKYFAEDQDMLSKATAWAAAMGDDHGRLHQRDRTIMPHIDRPWKIPDWSVTAPEIVSSILEWGGTSMMAIHAGNPRQICSRLQRSVSVSEMVPDGDRYQIDNMTVRDGAGVTSTLILTVGRRSMTLKITRGAEHLPETLLLGLGGARLIDVVGHDALASAVNTRVLSASREDDMLILDLSFTDRVVAPAPDGVDMTWLRLRP